MIKTPPVCKMVVAPATCKTDQNGFVASGMQEDPFLGFQSIVGHRRRGSGAISKAPLKSQERSNE